MPEINLAGISASIFDMDGTLVDNMRFHGLAWVEYFKRNGIAFSMEQFEKQYSGLRTDALLQKLYGRAFLPEELKEIATLKERIYQELYDPFVTEVPGLSPFLDNLSERGVKLALATGAPKYSRDWILGRLGLSSRFSVVKGAEDVLSPKPDSQIFLSTAEALNVEPQACLAFEDAITGVIAAVNANMRVFGISTMHSPRSLRQAGAFASTRDYRSIVLV